MPLVLKALMRNKLLVTYWKTELFITFRLTFVTVQASCIKSDLMQECSPIVKSQVCWASQEHNQIKRGGFFLIIQR